METIFKKHCQILLEDPHLKPLLPDIPRVTYRKAPNLKNKIAPSTTEGLDHRTNP